MILAGLHANQIIVQDLKPSNVLLDEQGDLVVADFGLAVMVERTITSSMISQSRTTGAGAGTIDYMAPEQHDSGTFGKVSQKTDMWALGCIILEMLTGRSAWAGKRPTEVMFHVAMKREAPPIPSGLPEGLESVLRACLVHSQEQRASAQEVAEMLQPTGQTVAMQEEEAV